jgi:Flp pilus assembly protein TadG
MGRCIKSFKQWLRFFRRQESGATAVEFALIAAPFFALIIMVFETSTMLFTDISLQNGVNQTSRLIRTGQVQTQGISEARFREILCGNVAFYLDCSKIRIFVTKSTTPTFSNRTNLMTATATTPQRWEIGAASEWTLVQVSYDWKLFIPKISMLGNVDQNTRRIVAGTLFRNEPFGG